MPLDREILRRQIADHKRAIAELESMLAELETRSPSGPSLNGLDRVEILRAHCLSVGVNVLPGGLVSAADAARLTGLSMKTLRNWRADLADDLPSVSFNGRPAYRLEDLARYLE